MQHFRSILNFVITGNYILLLFLLLETTQGEKTDRTSPLSQKIYQPISGVFPCFRRMNGTHQIGCSTNANGNVGILHFLDYENSTEKEGLEWVLEKGPHAPYIVLMYLPSFTKEVLKKLNNPDRVSGVLLLEKDGTRSRDAVPTFSPDSQCPNQGYGLYNKTDDKHFEWNPPGSSLLFEDWTFSIIYIQGQDQGQILVDCYKTHNEPDSGGKARDWPLCGAQLKAHMIAAVDTPTCVRRNDLSTSVWNMSPRSVCDPVGGLNIWSPLATRSQAEPYPESNDGSVIVIATRLDASSMFDKIAPGADTSATGLTALMALAKQLQPLKKYLPNKEIQNVYFIIFNGEAFDYIGSSRIVYDMMRDKFPVEKKENSSSHSALLRLKDIKYFIELDQLAHYDDSSSYYIHRNWDSKSIVVQTVVNELEKQAKEFKLNLSPVPIGDFVGLPPASLQSFLAQEPDLPGIVITNHNTSFENMYYNSIMDDDTNIGYNGSTTGRTVRAISSLVATIGRTVELLISPDIVPNVIIDDQELVSEILQCYVQSANCPLFLNLRKDNKKVVERTFPLYAGVYGRYSRFTLASDVTAKLMTYYQGQIIDKSEGDCKHDDQKPIFDFLWLNGSCYNTSVGVTMAKSPAFDIEDYDWTSRKYSTWTESSWNQFSVRIFLKPSLTHDILTLCFGLAVFIISSFIIYWVNGKSELIFQTRREQIC